MAQVTLRINGYAYTIGCRDGEEQHLQSMAAQVEQRIDRIKSTAGQSGEARMLVMAALLMADDLFENQHRRGYDDLHMEAQSTCSGSLIPRCDQ